jgi:hypothetical protein
MAWRDRYRTGTNNPRGAPKAWETFAAILQELADGPWPVPENFDQGNAKRRLCAVTFAKAMGGDLAAINWVVERIEGDVPDVVRMDANVRNDSPVRDEEVAAFRDYLRLRNGAASRQDG